MSSRSHDVEKLNNELGESVRQEVLRVLDKWDASWFVIEERLRVAALAEPMDPELRRVLHEAHGLVAFGWNQVNKARQELRIDATD